MIETKGILVAMILSLGTVVSAADWGPPVNLGSRVNSSWDEGDCSITADATKLYFSSNRPGGYGGYDIWMSNWDGYEWNAPENVGAKINTSGDESYLAVSADGTRLFFTSINRPFPGGIFPSSIIWVSNCTEAEWQEPMDTGAGMTYYVDDVYSSHNDSTLYYTGAWDVPLDADIYMVGYRDGKWQDSELLNINTGYWERMGCLSFDGTEIYFLSWRLDDGEMGMRNWVATGNGAEWYKSALLGPNINDGQTKVECISQDGNKLFLISKREGGFGDWDIWTSQNSLSVDNMTWGRLKSRFRR